MLTTCIRLDILGTSLTYCVKQEIEQLIDRLASKELTFGCEILWKPEYGDKAERAVVYAEYRDRKHYLGACILESEKSKGFYTAFTKANIVKNFGHPILIGDVLKAHSQMLDKKPIEEKLAESKAFVEKNWPRHAPVSEDPNYVVNQVFEIVSRWEACGDTTKSLQSIFDEAEWEEEQYHNHGEQEGCNDDCLFEIPRQPHIRELFQFLLTLGL